MKSIKFLVIFISLLSASCSPFGDQTIISDLVTEVTEAINSKTTFDINSGGSQLLISNPASGVSTDVHQVSISVGNSFKQTSYVTDKGHTVELVISGVK